MSTTLSPTERDALLQQFSAMESRTAGLRLLTPRAVREIGALESSDDPIVSLYLDLGPDARQDRKWATVFKNLSRDALARQDGRAARSVAETLARIESSLAGRVTELGRGVALFASAPTDLWHEILLPVPLPNRLVADRRPYMRPLFRIYDEHDRFVVVLLDDQRARLFVIHLGHIVEVADLFEAGPPHHAQGGWAQMRLQRQHDAHVLWHAGAVAHATTLAMEHFSAPNLLLSGTPDAVAEYRQQLAPAAAGRLAGEFRVAVTASPADVMQALSAVQAEAEAREEVATIERVANARSGGRGTWGLEPTLRALGDGRVMTLVARHDFRAPGGMCIDSGMLTANAIGLCPHCGEAVTAVDDVVDIALERAFRQSAELEMVRSADGRAALERYEPIGALLRF